MARNEEKQLGKLNRLWLQKERAEGRIKDIHEPRPKLATLNSVAAVKKWIPSIKSEIEYYLQQSQLSHYPERKITEFQQQIEHLEKEYKRYLYKLRSLDPTCKHKPWTPRAYTKRRQDTDSSQCLVKRLCDPDLGKETCSEEGATTSAPFDPDLPKQSTASTSPTSDFPEQDLPLAFDRTKLAVAVSGSWRAPFEQLQDITKLACVLHRGLPNLHSSKAPAGELQEGQETKQPPCSEIPQNKTEHVLGLGCYSSSSDEET